ncbi:flagellar hook-length control protein FliK [Solidesulfovibrio sp.]
MQILPLIQSRTQSASADAALTGSAGLASRQSALFASILDSARTSASSRTIEAAAETARAVAEPARTAEPSDDELKTLPVTREDIAALRDDLKEQGFSDDELDTLEDRAGDGQGMTWGELMDEVERKVATTDKGSRKDIANDDQVQLLGLFGKLGFTPEESQQMIDALSRGETQSVWASINAKLDGAASDDTFRLSSSELTALGRAMNLSDDAQSRLVALFDQSGAEAGLSGEGIITAMGLVKNELTAQIGKENQALADFRQAASAVLADAWQRESGKRNSDLFQDDVARKAGQIVAMSHEQDGADAAGTSSIDALSDVPQTGQGLAETEAGLASDAGQGSQTAQAGGSSQAGSFGQAAGREAMSAALAGKAGAVAAEQAALAGENGQTTAQPQAQPEVAPQAAAKASSGVAANAEVRDMNFFGGQQGAGGNAFGQNGQNGQDSQDGSMAEFMSKIRFAGRTGAAQSGQTAETTPAMAAMDAAKMTSANQQAKSFDPALAARAARQVESGILRGVAQEARQLTINLTPDELGPLQVTLTVKDKEVRAIILADNTDTAAMLQEQAAKIKQTLEDQGFKVTKLDVQTGLAQDNQTAWDSPERHNEAREQREAMERIRNSVRLAREAAGSDADSAAAIPGAMPARAAGLDLFA